MNNLDKEKLEKIIELIQECKNQIKHYEETKESLLSNLDIPDKIKEIYIGLGEALYPTLKILYEVKEKYEQSR